MAFDIISDQLNIIVKFELEINVLPMNELCCTVRSLSALQGVHKKITLCFSTALQQGVIFCGTNQLNVNRHCDGT